MNKGWIWISATMYIIIEAYIRKNISIDCFRSRSSKRFHHVFLCTIIDIYITLPQIVVLRESCKNKIFYSLCIWNVHEILIKLSLCKDSQILDVNYITYLRLRFTLILFWCHICHLESRNRVEISVQFAFRWILLIVTRSWSVMKSKI